MKFPFNRASCILCGKPVRAPLEIGRAPERENHSFVVL